MDTMMEQYIETMTNILTPVMERATILAAEYSKACGRDVLIPEDIEYAMKYCAMHTVGLSIGTLFPEIYEDDEDSDEEVDVVSEEECPEFVRYSGEDPKFLNINDAYDQWGEWVPQNPTEELLKNTINSNVHMGA
jgi:hypothetical protein